jgi:hypothetical protein
VVLDCRKLSSPPAYYLISNPKVAGSIPAAPINLFYSLEANLALSHCKLTASWRELDCNIEGAWHVSLPIRRFSLGAREMDVNATWG